jgi:hypothetical protein
MGRPKPASTRQPNPAVGWIALIVLCGMTAILFVRPLARRGLPPVVALLVGALCVFVAVTAAVLLLTRTGPLVLSQYARAFPGVDWRAARRASPAMRMLDSKHPLTVWSDFPDDSTFDVHRETDRVCQEFAELTALAVPAIRPVRVLLFERWESYRRYAGGLLGDLDLAGFYTRQFAARIALNREGSRTVYEDGEVGPFETLMGHHLLAGHYRKLPEHWLLGGIAVELKHRLDTTPIAPGKYARFHLAELQRGELLSPEELLGQTTRMMAGLGQRKVPLLEKLKLMMRISHQGSHVVSWLSRNCRPRFAEFLESRRPTRMSPEDFEREFGVSAAHILDSTTQDLTASPPPDYQAPPPHLQTFIDEQWVPKLLDPSTPLSLRRLILVNLSRIGYPWRADVLLRYADDDLDELQPHALYAVENIAGRVFAHDRRPMREWYRSLPAEVVSPRARGGRISAS